MNKKSLVLILVVLWAPSIVHAAVLLNESFESGLGPFYHDGTAASVVTDSTAPDGTHSLRFLFPSGMPAGNPPDIVSTDFTPSKEIWGRFYFKQSENFVFGHNAIEQKLFFMWGSNFNCYIGIGAWRSDQLYFVWQGTGQTFQGYTGPAITVGVWYKVDFHMKMNTSNNTADGVLQVWVNDTLSLNFSNVPYVSSPGWWNPNPVSEKGFFHYSFSPVYGGDSPVPHDQYIWFDKAIVQTDPLSASFTGGSSPPPPTATAQPVAPSNLRIN